MVIPAATVLADVIGTALGIAAAITALMTGGGRYRAVLKLEDAELDREQRDELIEVATARGFFVGLVASAVVILVSYFASVE